MTPNIRTFMYFHVNGLGAFKNVVEIESPYPKISWVDFNDCFEKLFLQTPKTIFKLKVKQN